VEPVNIPALLRLLRERTVRRTGGRRGSTARDRPSAVWLWLHL